MRCIKKDMQKKLVKKVAYQLWQYEVDKDTSSNFEKYSKIIKQKIDRYIGTEMSKIDYIALLDIYSTLGYLPGNLKLELFLYKQLLLILVAAIRADKLKNESDD